VVPFANPIGLSQRMLALHVGRGDLGGGGNFNRGFPNLLKRRSASAGALGSDRAANDSLVRSALRDAAEALQSNTELDMLKVALLRLAVDAHIVLDLHCHMEGLTYLYCNEAGCPRPTTSRRRWQPCHTRRRRGRQHDL
jgi:predicted deacylase